MATMPSMVTNSTMPAKTNIMVGTVSTMAETINTMAVGTLINSKRKSRHSI